MRKIKTFIASSDELTEERKEIALFLCRENRSLIDNNIFLDLVIWEDLLHSFRGDRIQNYFNQEMLKCDIVIALFYKKIGYFTKEEFDLAYNSLQMKERPFYLFTYFKKGEIPIDEADENILKVRELKKAIKKYDQIYDDFNSIEDLTLKLKRQFDHILSEYIGYETACQVSSAKSAMIYSNLAPEMSFEEVQNVYNRLENEAMSGKPEDVEKFKHFLQAKYFPFMGEYSKRGEINYVDCWDKVFRKGGALSKIEGNIKAEQYIRSLQDFKHSMMFSKLIPVQSYEQYQNEYERLEKLAIDGGMENFKRFIRFLEEDYFLFMKAYMGGNNKRYISLWKRVFGENGTIAKIEEAKKQ